ncbi:nicotinate-nucleotide adenylyltransferase [Sphaerisporangium corydalis]|uniref:Probable nicotinate-nucleotide adenylyltransferase n=1 Tax=Sphaerisporangium corydalis TaxID=1441875 RepID=A0ABV9EGQ5_9ACTN|nr:nicotinate-nucleotide adenylyltransferase [Sphaerisporangium corydalis]
MAVRLGIMGGTFDPIHNVHLLKASEAAYRLGLDEVLFVPAGRPWQKDLLRVSGAEERYVMTRLAVAADPRFSVSRMEVDRAGPTYAVDTLRELRRLHGPCVQLFFIAGADVLASIATWREARSLGELAHFVFCSRPGYELGGSSLLGRERVTLLHVPVWEISSTVIRQRVSRVQSIRYLVPDPVVDYITERGLYRE